MASVTCTACVSILFLLEVSIYGNGSPVQPIVKREHPITGNRQGPEGCQLRQKSFLARTINWTRLILESRITNTTVEGVVRFHNTNVTISPGDNVSSIHNTNFTISYCSGRCLQHNTMTTGHVIKDNYALQMRNLVKSCEDNNMNCEELTPCCVPKRYHGDNNQSKIEFEKRNVTVEFVYRQHATATFTYQFLNPTVCHCQ